MANPFESLISPAFKGLYNQAIDAILADNALTVPCTLNYATSKISLCNNCIFDPITDRSSNRYNNTGPVSFANLSICPVCNGYGYLDKTSSEIVYMAVLFDSKYWFNWSPKNSAVNIADGMIQTICNISLLPKIKNIQSMTVDSQVEKYKDHSYVVAGDPQPCGLGENRYIITMWSRA